MKLRWLLHCNGWIQRAGFMRMLHLFFSIFGDFKAPPIGLEYELQCVD